MNTEIENLLARAMQIIQNDSHFLTRDDQDVLERNIRELVKLIRQTYQKRI